MDKRAALTYIHTLYRLRKKTLKDKTIMAMKCFDKVIEYEPEFIDAWNKKGVVYYDLDEFQEAIDCCEKVIKIEPNNKQTLYNIGISLLNLEKYNQANQFFEKLLTYYPDFKLLFLCLKD